MRTLVTVPVIILTGLLSARGSDWTTWRADSARSGYTKDALPQKLALCWSWTPRHAPRSAWPRDERMKFDRANHVVVAGGMVFFGSSADGTVSALDAATGVLKWRFFTEGPVRFAPVAWKDELFVVSDDGHLYCLNQRKGTLIKRWRGGPREDRVLGNSQMTSKWPARGGPVIQHGVLYWAAGIWQSEGVFIRALDLDTGKLLWINDSAGEINMPQPHGGANAKSGVSAQGYLLANDERLFVPTGRAVPAAFNRATGKFDYYHLQKNGQRGGTSAMLAGELIYNGGYTYWTKAGSLLGSRTPATVATIPGGVVQGSENRLQGLAVVMKEQKDNKGNVVKVPTRQNLWEVKGIPAGTSLIAAGDAVVTSGGNKIAMVKAKDGESIWSSEVDDVAHGLAVSDGRLFVSTASGAVHCFAAKNGEPVLHRSESIDAPYGGNEAISQAASEILKQSGITAGYCVDLGCGDGRLAYELARQSDLLVVAIDPDPAKAALARKNLDAAGFLGARVSVHVGDPSKSSFPKHFANLVVSRSSLEAGAAVVNTSEAQRLQRPFGGVVCLGRPGAMSVHTRGALANAGEWTHQYSSPANTLCSTDSIKGPLTAVWFRDIDLNLPQRHGRGPSPLFHEGRLIVEGLDELIAVDAYNGLPLWRFEQKGVLAAYNADHLVGTAVTGSNFCIAGGNVFLRNGTKCFRIEAATGKLLATYETPKSPDGTVAAWGYVASEDGVLYGSAANEEHIVRHAYIRADKEMEQQFSESSSFFALEAETGKLLWRYDAQESIRHNAIAIGAGRVHLIDRAVAPGDLLTGPRGKDPKGQKPSGHPTGKLFTFSAKTGEKLWDSDHDIFGTTLAFSERHDTLLMFYQPTRFRLPSETGGRIAAFRAGAGDRLWESKVNYSTRPLINYDTIIAHPVALNLVSGKPVALNVPKSYGCGQVAGSRNLLVFRSGTLGYYDLTRKAGTENYGGLRPGCWINALPVGGLVLVPDASSGCKCSYQNRAWVALEGSD